MKLYQIQEARYHVHPAVELVYRAREQDKSHEKKFSLHNLQSTINALTKEFGEPTYEEQTWMTGGSSRRWIWTNQFQVDQYEDFAYIHTYESIPF